MDVDDDDEVDANARFNGHGRHPHIFDEKTIKKYTRATRQAIASGQKLFRDLTVSSNVHDDGGGVASTMIVADDVVLPFALDMKEMRTRLIESARPDRALINAIESGALQIARKPCDFCSLISINGYDRAFDINKHPLKPLDKGGDATLWKGDERIACLIMTDTNRRSQLSCVWCRIRKRSCEGCIGGAKHDEAQREGEEKGRTKRAISAAGLKSQAATMVDDVVKRLDDLHDFLERLEEEDVLTSQAIQRYRDEIALHAQRVRFTQARHRRPVAQVEEKAEERDDDFNEPPRQRQRTAQTEQIAQSQHEKARPRPRPRPRRVHESESP